MVEWVVMSVRGEGEKEVKGEEEASESKAFLIQIQKK